MGVEIGKQIAKRELAHLGFAVSEVPVGDGKTADLLVTDSKAKYLIEVKDKSEPDSLSAEMAGAFSRGELHESRSPLSYSNRISGVLSNAQKQLDDTSKDVGTFQLIWFHSTGMDADLKYRQAFATFYGQMYLRAPFGQTAPEFGCFYWNYSGSYSMPTIEALILSDKEQLQFCLNEFSIRANEFRQTALCRKFVELNGVIDPLAWAADGKMIPLRSNVPRKNEAIVAEALLKQTGVLYSAIVLDRYTFTLGRQPEDDDPAGS